MLAVDEEIRDIITKELAWHYFIVPKEKKNDIVVFYYNEKKEKDPIKNDLKIILGQDIELIASAKEDIEEALVINYRKSNSQEKAQSNQDFLESIIAESIQLGSSDIHFEVFNEVARVRIRIDGLLIEKTKIAKEDYQEIVNRIKIQSGLDITEKRLPQDGRSRILGQDIRVSILPTLYGEKIVLRILGQDASNINIEELGFDSDELNEYTKATKRSNGIVLISGPTGSGKTTTLYATLKILNEVKKNILTVEDPIEYTLNGINQVQLKESIGLTFSSALKSFLRQDPDVIMLGEIRDGKTAEMAVRASLTGHLVLSTIHTNSALGTISRLVDMGIPSFLLAETLNISVAQRLVRRLCSSCKRIESIDISLFPDYYRDLIEFEEYYVPTGCEKCFYSGYLGRRAIYELIPIDNILADKIKHKESLTSLDLDSNFQSLAHKALKLIECGETSLEEVYSILINQN